MPRQCGASTPDNPFGSWSRQSPDYRVRLTFSERRAGEFLVDYLAKQFKGFDSQFAPGDCDRFVDDGALCWSFATEEERRRFVSALHTVVGIQ